MGLFDKLKTAFKRKEEAVQTEPKKAPKVAKKVTESEKDLATKAGEPYVNILRMDVDPNDINSGAFELDWNEIFVARLVKSGYMMNKDDKDSDIVDRWFQQVCRNVALEVYEQQQADPDNRMLRSVNTRDLGNGKTEVS